MLVAQLSGFVSFADCHNFGSKAIVVMMSFLFLSVFVCPFLYLLNFIVIIIIIIIIIIFIA